MKRKLFILRTLLKKKFECDVGYSGHEPSVSPSIIAATLGANSIERHITLDRSMYGSDQSASLEISGMNSLTISINKIIKALTCNPAKILKINKSTKIILIIISPLFLHTISILICENIRVHGRTMFDVL